MEEINRDVIYDIEVLPNVFTVDFFVVRTQKAVTFEISERQNDLPKILKALSRMRVNRASMYGYRNIDYDYPVIHYLMTELKGFVSAKRICHNLYLKSKSIIDLPYNKRFAARVPEWKRIIHQVDLYLMHHFDNKNKQISLKQLEVNMRMSDVQEFGVFDRNLTDEEIDHLKSYNVHDRLATYKFYLQSQEQIAMRKELGARFGKDFTSANDGKIGTEIFIKELEKKLGDDICFTRTPGEGRKKKQTKRESLELAPLILDCIDFELEEFKAIKRWFESKTITETKGVFSELPLAEFADLKDWLDFSHRRGVQEYLTAVQQGRDDVKEPRINKKLRKLHVVVDGTPIYFGLGGIHASLHKKRIESCEKFVIVDVDVRAFYPSISIEHNFYPEHLTDAFPKIFKQILQEREKHKKGTSLNKGFKLSANATYGNTNNQYSPFLDIKCTMSITINGQLLLCKLFEMLRKIPELSMIQMNTDGMTVKLPRDQIKAFHTITRRWENLSRMKLEEIVYDYMHIRDVNNYVAKAIGEVNRDTWKLEKYDSIKRKGQYAHIRPDEKGAELEWHKNMSCLVVKKAACAFIENGTPIEEFIKSYDNYWDFILTLKLPKSNRAVLTDGLGLEYDTQLVGRYYISNKGCELHKVMPPTKKNPDKYRWQVMNKDTLVTMVNRYEGEELSDINYDWYIAEANKLVEFDFDTEDVKSD